MSLNFTSTFLIDDIMCIVINSEWIKKNKKFITNRIFIRI